MATPTNPYSAPAISGFNSNPPPDDGTFSAANRTQWSKHISKIGNPLKTLVEAAISASTSAFNKLVMTTDAAEENVIVTMEEFS